MSPIRKLYKASNSSKEHLDELIRKKERCREEARLMLKSVNCQTTNLPSHMLAEEDENGNLVLSK